MQNLLGLGAVKGYRIVPGYEWPGYAQSNNWTQRAACVPGKTYTLSIVTDVAGEVCFGFYLADGSAVRPYGYQEFNAGQSVVRTLTAPENAEYVAASWADGNRRPMVVEGDTPAAWAPAEGETLAGGGALMSANLLDDATVTRGTKDPDGYWVLSKSDGTDKKDTPMWRVDGQPTLSENQTLHVACSVMPDEDWGSNAARMSVQYADAAGHFNWVGSNLGAARAGAWTRLEAELVVPSGMRVTQCLLTNGYRWSSGAKVANPVFSYGSAPLTLASAEHTHQVPYVPVLYTYETDVPSKVELTYTDASFHDVGLIEPYDGDFAYGNSENDFSVDTTGDSIPEVGAMMYAEGSDVGGIVTGYSSDAAMGTFSVVGDTWTGVLDRRVVGPDSGSDYLALSGDVRDIVAALVSRAGLTGLFRVAEGRTGITASHTFTGSTSSEQQDAGRYMGAWTAIWQVCVDHGCKCRFAWSDVERRVVVTVARLADYTDDEAQSAGLATVGVSIRRPTNHLVCLGKGDLKAREVLHLYADRSGNVSTSQSIKGVDEIAEVYDDSSAEGDKLRTDGTKKLRELWQASQEVTVKSGTTSADFDLGDVIGGTDPWSGLTARAIVTKKVASFKQGTLTYTYTSTVRG